MAAHPLAPRRSLHPVRLLGVACGLVGLGAFAGGTAGILTAIGALPVLGWNDPELGLRGLLELLGFAAVFGGVLGAATLPVAGFAVLRAVPLWRIVVHTTLGTALGAIAALVVEERYFLVAAYGGFALACVELWARARRAG